MRHPSKYELSQFFSGDLTSAEIKNHVHTCRECRDFIEELEKAQAQLIQKESPEEFLVSIAVPVNESRKAAASPRFGIRVPVFIWAAGVAIVVAVLSVFLYSRVQTGDSFFSVQDTGLRWKGAAPVVEVFINRNNTVHISRDSTILPGDEVQYRITLPKGETAYTAVVARENGAFESVFPGADTQEPLSVSGTFELPGAIHVEKDTAELSLYLILKQEPFKIDRQVEQMKSELTSTGDISESSAIMVIHHTPDANR